MAKFLNTSGTNYFLEELIKSASDRLILISPFLKLNDRMKELLIDKNRLKIDVRIVYGKRELQPEEINWLKELTFIRISFCENLHAKCYVNEDTCIITSLNLYQFSQVNNNEMGVFIDRNIDSELYRDTYEEVQRIIRISDEVKMTLEKKPSTDPQEESNDKLTTSKLAKKHGFKTSELLEKMVDSGYLFIDDKEKHKLSDKGKKANAEYISKARFGGYFLWPEDFKLNQ
jgi:phosphatidylserine/phosphatidylglycerophosphate/cardiolipin synthase-like enzyme